MAFWNVFGPVLILLLWITVLRAGRLISDKRVLDICMDAKHHHSEPQSTKLYGLCKPWETNACCSNQTAFHSQQALSQLYGLNLNHCGKMSQKCLNRFFISNCFYECSPNVGPWLKPVRSSIRNERFYHVPLCASECSAWWEDCKDDMTCVSDFARGFHWKNGTNHCPPESVCQSFKNHFHNATYFCENLYPHDFKVVHDPNERCMKFNFEGPANPNAQVARSYAIEKNMQVPTEEYSDHSETATSPSSYGGTVTNKDVNLKDRTIIAMAVIIFLLACLCIGLAACKCKDTLKMTKRAGIDYLAKLSCCRKKQVSVHSVVHHQRLQDDRHLLQEAEEDNDSAINPHGALEIDL